MFARVSVVAMAAAACMIAPLPAMAQATASPAASEAASSADRQFQTIWKEEWAWRQKETPRRGLSDSLPHVDAQTQARRLAYWGDVLKKLDAIKPSDLSAAERVNYAVYRNQIETFVDDGRFRLYEMPFNSDSSFWANLAGSARRPFNSVEDYERYLRRLSDTPRYFDENIANMRSGLKRGFSVPKETLAGRDVSIAAVAEATTPEQNLFYEPFRSMPSRISAAEQTRLRAEAVAVIRDKVVPAHAELLTFFRNEYVPQARSTLAAEAMPDGKAFYQAQIRQYTTLDLTPDQIHQIGLSEVKRIRAEMDAVMKSTGFRGDFPAFLTFLRTDPQFQFDKPEHLLWYGAWITKKVDGKVGDYIGNLPRARFTIRPVPDSIAPFYTAGRGGDGSCLLNTYDLKSRPRYNLAALTVHECMPGHAFHSAVRGEQKSFPEFREATQISAFSEGWALYTEKLGIEMGVYETPYDDFGRLTYEMWRAARLVIDTGLHSKGWTRAQAVAFLKDNTALSEHEVGTEIDRYITWPGQALAYKLGEMEIVRLRKKAETQLGAGFDIKAFHDTLLGLGIVPLPIMTEEMERFIAEGGKAPARPAD